MIVRISGEGQYELHDDALQRLDELDTKLTDAVNNSNDQEFHQLLKQTIDYIRSGGSAVPDDQIVPSQVIVPPADSSLADAKDFFTNEGLMEPLEA
jgi:hypothetical protein